jgi:hypothetical protein
MKSEEEIREQYQKLLNSRTEDMHALDAAEVTGMIKALRWVLEV